MLRGRPRRLRRIDSSASRMGMKRATLVHLNVHLRTWKSRVPNRYLVQQTQICPEIPVA